MIYLNIKSQISLFFFISISSIIYSQQTAIDSLYILKEKQHLADSLIRKGKYISASRVLISTLDLVSYGKKEEKILTLYRIGKAYEYSKDIDSAMHFYNKAEKIYNDSVSELVKSYRSINKASIFFGNQKIDSAIYYAFKGLDHALQSKNKSIAFDANIAIGKIFLFQQNFKKSLLYFNDANIIADNSKDSVLHAEVLLNKGKLEIEKGNYAQSEEYLIKALKIFENHDRFVSVFSAKVFLSMVYSFTGRLNKSMEARFEFISMVNEFEFRGSAQKMVANSNAIIDLEKKDTLVEKDIRKVDSLLKNNEKMSLPNEQILMKKGFVTYLKDTEKEIIIYKKDNPKTIQGKLEEVIIIQDSIYQASLKAKYIEFETKHQTQKKEKENLQLIQLNTEQELELEKENKRKWIFAIGLLMSLVVLSVFFFFYRRNQRQKRIIVKLQRELHHRIKNNLAIIDTFIDTAKDDITDEKGKQKLTELQNRIESIYKVHELLYKTEGNITEVSAKTYIDTLVKGVQQSFSDKPVTILMDINSGITFNAEQSFPVGLIVNEFLTNSYKYAFGDRNDGKVTISIVQKENTYYLEFSDNGIGLPKNFDISTLDSFGMDVMKLLANQLEGSFQLDGASGVSLQIQFLKK